MFASKHWIHVHPPRLSKYFFFYKHYMMCFQPDLITSLCFRRGKITFTRNLPESGSVLDHALRRRGLVFYQMVLLKDLDAMPDFFLH